MTPLHFPWLSLLFLSPAAGVGAVFIWRRHSHPIGIGATLLGLVMAMGSWIELGFHKTVVDPWVPLLTLDELGAPLVFCCAVMTTAVIFTMPKSHRTPALTAKFLASETILLLTFCSVNPWFLAALFAAGSILPWFETRSRIFAVYMGISVLLFVLGVAAGLSHWACLPLVAAVLIRKGILPLHSWMPSFFQSARFGTVVLFAMPQAGTYCAARLILPSAPPATLEVMGILALLTSVYAAWLGLVQKDVRRMFGYFFMSQSAVVLAGMTCDNLGGLAGSLTLWISSILSLTGFGVALRALEARRGLLSLDIFHGGYERMPLLAAGFLVLGLACVGIPGTLGFVAQELLVDGSVESFPGFGFLVAVAAALNGITILRAYGSLFCGAPTTSGQEQLRPRERLAMMGLLAFLLACGLWPVPLLKGNLSAASVLLGQRQVPAASLTTRPQITSPNR
ncbi:MAG TPA: proton-conducting transporter membrane subunit [bacterium]|nr:proton-conducting transporter membrane subunit [bacterium]